MSHFEDLTPYSYTEKSSGELNVGWLEASYPFPTGPVPTELVEGLAWLCVHAPVMRTRGFHICSLCPGSSEIGAHSVVLKGRKHLLGTGEIRVQGNQVVYAAPTLILHYVADHAYSPPEDFVSAILKRKERLSLESWSLFRGPYW